MILIDDLRPALGCYGDRLAVTPNIDALANQSVRFDAAYASVPTCSPSRTSLLTGLRPDTHGVHDLETHFRTTVPGVKTLPQTFKEAGYLSLSYGKVFHETLDDAKSWSPQADFDDGEVWRGTERSYGHDWWYMEYDNAEHAPQRADRGPSLAPQLGIPASSDEPRQRMLTLESLALSPPTGQAVARPQVRAGVGARGSTGGAHSGPRHRESREPRAAAPRGAPRGGGGGAPILPRSGIRATAPALLGAGVGVAAY